MNLKRLFEIQKQLDNHIIENKGLQGQDLLEEKVLALKVELGELANELPEVFKFWSNKKNNYEKALKEYVDGLHFILSIGLDHGFHEDLKGLAIESIEWENITCQFLELLRIDWEKYECGEGDYYHSGLEMFLSLGEMIGFTWEQIEQAYLDKNKVNHERQESGY
jgi:dimeric dUTPase (all-alpha-NTP-PPase superfamily)